MYLDIEQKSEFKNNNHLNIITDRKGIIQFISPNCLGLIGIEPNSIVFEQHYLNLFIKDNKEAIENKIGEIQKNNKKSTGYFSVQLINGKKNSQVELNINILNDKQEVFKGFLLEVRTGGTHSNIEKEYKQLLDNIPLGIYRTKVNGEIVFINQSFFDIFQFTDVNDIGIKNNHLFVDENYRESHIKDWIKQEKYRAEFKAYTKSGEIICLKDEGKVVRDDQGNVIYFDGILENICEQKAAEEKLQELNLSKDKFLSIISHDLKVPFGQFISATDLILEKINEFDIEQIEKLVRLLNDQAIKSHKLLENLLEWSRSQKGLIEFNPQPVNLNALVNNVIGDLSQLAENKNIAINYKINKGLFIYADHYMLSTIIRNLISNAIKFTKNNGQINISAKYKFAQDQFGDKYLEVSVEDDGIGIRDEDIVKLFRIDTAFSSKGTQKESGTGLGLILCKDFVEKHGGKIWVESEIEKGSTFKFTLP